MTTDVSILVLMDLAREYHEKRAQKYQGFSVSILVLMDLARENNEYLL
ncbi:hypothetical protein [Methanosarcina mazei]|nr:hypothetical protein [Methanosarcina mazei]